MIVGGLLMFRTVGNLDLVKFFNCNKCGNILRCFCFEDDSNYPVVAEAFKLRRKAT